MRHLRIALLALFALAAAPAAALHAQAPAVPPVEAAGTGAAPSGASSLPRYTPPRTLRAYWHVFAAFAVVWLLLFGYVVFLSRRFRAVEAQVEALARP